MADLSRDDVTKLAALAQLHLTDSELDEFSGELAEILKYVEQLQNVDVNGLEPTLQVTGLTNVTRPDEIINYGYSTDVLLKNVPATDSGQIKVKRMVG